MRHERRNDRRVTGLYCTRAGAPIDRASMRRITDVAFTVLAGTLGVSMLRGTKE